MKRTGSFEMPVLGSPAGAGDWMVATRDIRLPNAWLGDAIEHRRDHWYLQALLAAMDGLPANPRYRRLLETAIALLRLHVMIQSKLHARSELRVVTDHLFTLIEQLERGSPEHPLYLSQSASLRFGIGLVMMLENELRSDADAPVNPEPMLLAERRRLFERAGRLLRRDARRAVYRRPTQPGHSAPPPSLLH